MRSLITKLLITQALAVSQAEFFMDAILALSWIQNWKFAHSKYPFPLRNLPQISLTRRRWSTKMFAEMSCRLKSNIKHITTKSQRFQAQRSRCICLCFTTERRLSGKIVPFTEVGSVGIVEKMLPNKNYIVRKFGTNKTQIHYCMRMRHFTPRQPLPDIQITPQEQKPDAEVSLKFDYLYARAWKCEYEKSIFDGEKDNATAPNSPEIAAQSDLSTEETWNIRRTAQERYQEIFLQMDKLCDVTDTYPYVERNAETRPEQPNNSPTNPHF